MNYNNNNNRSVCYCCVWKDGRIVYKYTTGNHEIHNMAALCLEMIPPYHRCYFETIAAFTFAFLIDSHTDSDPSFVYFAILRHSPGNSHLLSFLQKLRDEFKRIGSREEKFVAVIRRLVASLECVVSSAAVWPAMNGYAAEAAGTSCTKAPLLDKKMMKEDADDVVVRDLETGAEQRQRQRQRRSFDGQGTSSPDFNTSTSEQNERDKWCRQVRIVLAIDAAVCIVLLITWLVICSGIDCIR